MIHEVRVAPELVAGWVVQGAEISARCIKGLPEGCTLISCVLKRGLTGPDELAILFRSGEGSFLEEKGIVQAELVYERINPITPGVKA